MKEVELPQYHFTYQLGDKVRFNNKIGKDEGTITGIVIRQIGIGYDVTWSDKNERFHYDFELDLIC